MVSIGHGAELKRAVRFVLSLTAGLLLLAAVGAICGLPEAVSAAKSISPAWLLPLSAVYSISWLLRGARLRMALSMQGVSKGFLDSLSLELAADLVNQFVPARLGDAVKVVYLKRRDGLGYAEGIFSAVLVRILDLAALLVLAGLCLVMLPAGSGGAGAASMAAGFAVLSIIILAGSLFWFRPDGFARLLAGPLHRFREPILRVRDGISGAGRRVPGLFLISCAIWIFDVMTLYTFLAALDINLGSVETGFVLFLSNLAKAVPFSPNGLGVYEGATVALLTGFGVDQAKAFAAGVLDHAFMNLFSALLSLGALARLGLSAGALGEMSRTAASLRDTAGSGQMTPEPLAGDEEVVP